MKKLITLITLLALTLSLFACGQTPDDTPSDDPIGSVSIQTVATHDDLVAKIKKGEISVAVLPEPKVTAALMQNSTYKVALNLSTEWSRVSDYSLAMGCIVVKNDFLKAHEGTVARFLDEYEASIDYIGNSENLDTAAQMIVSAGVLPKLPIAKSALQNLYGSIVYQDGDTMKNTLDSFYDAIGQTKPTPTFYAAPASSTDDGSVIRIGVMSGPTGMGMAKLMYDNADNETKYNFKVYSDPQTATADLAGGSLDMLCLPTNTAASLSMAKDDYISAVAVNCLGSLYVVVDANTTVNSIADLVDKTIWTSVPNSTTLPIVKYILTGNNIEIKED